MNTRLNLTVVVPTHNRTETARECLKGLSAQDYPKGQFEVVLVDDGSDPPFCPGKSAVDTGLTLRCIRTGGLGAAEARNRGAELAVGDLLIFLDDDCVPARDWLSVMARTAREHPGTAVGGLTRNGTPHNLFATASHEIVENSHRFWNQNPEDAVFLASQNIAFPSDGFRAISGFNAAFPYAEDRDICDRWIESGRSMRWEPGARVVHYRNLTLRTFWRQHYCYGRGARYLHNARRERHGGGVAPQPGLYVGLLQRILAQRPMHRIPGLAILVLVSQVAYATGMLLEPAPRA